MKDIPRLFPIWFLPVLVLIAFWVITCQGCRGGRSLGNGSAGTVIVPQTPQQINERNSLPPPPIVLPPLEPLAPIPLVPSARTHTNAVRSNPVIPEPKSAKANPVIINPKPAGEPKPFSPSVSPTPKLIEGDGGCVVITDGKSKPEGWCGTPTDNKATSPKTTIGGEKNKVTLNWNELIMWWIFLFLAVIFGWVVFDIIKEGIKSFRDGGEAKKPIKKPAKGTRKSRKKAASKKNEKPKQ